MDDNFVPATPWGVVRLDECGFLHVQGKRTHPTYIYTNSEWTVENVLGLNNLEMIRPKGSSWGISLYYDRLDFTFYGDFNCEVDIPLRFTILRDSLASLAEVMNLQIEANRRNIKCDKHKMFLGTL